MCLEPCCLDPFRVQGPQSGRGYICLRGCMHRHVCPVLHGTIPCEIPQNHSRSGCKIARHHGHRIQGVAMIGRQAASQIYVHTFTRLNEILHPEY